MEVGQIRRAGWRVLERRQFRARGFISAPEAGVHSTSTYVVDLDRRLSLSSTVTAMDPDNADEQPWLSEPVTTWSTRDGLLVPLPSDDGTGPRWACVPDEPLLQGPLGLLLALGGAVTVSPTQSGAARSTGVGVDVDVAVEHVPSEHRAALQRFLDEAGLRAGSLLELEVRLLGEAVATVDADLPVEGDRPRAVLHLSIDPGPPPAVPDPPLAGVHSMSADEIARAWAVDRLDDLPVREPWRHA